MIAEQDQSLRLMAQEMAEALSRVGAEAVMLMQRFGLLAGLAPNGAVPPEPARPGAIGIWEPRGAAEPGVYERSAALRAHWPYWADVQTIPAKGEKKRIVLLGESVAYGFFYAPGLTPAQVLEHLVSGILGTAVEVIDLARAGLLAAELAALAGGALALEPDLCVIFAGNNWLPGELPPYTLERSLEAAALREGGVSAYKELRERNLFAQAVELMRRSFAQLARAVPVVLMVPEFNLADWPLDPEVDAPWLPAGGNRRWLECRAEARRALSAGEIERARELAREMLDLDGGTAGSGWVLLADCAMRLGGAGQAGDLAAARACREKARDARLWDNDRKGTWTHGKIQEALRLWGAEAGASVVDVPGVFAAWQHGELPDRRLFLDFCHLSAQGICVAMAAAARESARRLDGTRPLPALEELVAQAPAPSPRLEAEACLTAGLFNAQFGQDGEPMAHFFTQAARSPEVAGIMREALEVQVRRAPFWARAAAARLSYLLTSQLRDTFLGREFFSAEMLAAMANALEAEGRPARAFLDELQRGERSLSEVPQDLLSPYNSPSMVDRNVVWEGSYFYRAYSTVSRFPWVCRAPHEVGFELTCRRTATTAVPCQVFVNGAPLLEIAPGAAWEAFRFTAPAGQVRQGVNWLEIRWPADLPAGEERIARAAEEIENGRPYNLVPVFAEIHTFTAARREESAARESGAVDDEALVGAGADHAAGSRDLHLEPEQAALRDLSSYLLPEHYGDRQRDRHPGLWCDLGAGVANAVRRRLNERGVQVAVDETITPAEPEYSAPISKKQAAGVDIFFLGGLHRETA